MASRVLGKEDFQPEGFRWITLKRITWEDPHGRRRLWESAERTTRRGEVDGVAIVAKIVRKGRPTLLPVLKQYRPPIANYCLELPAGLVDAGETAAQAAVRELKEETGYSGRVCGVTPVCVSDPGMSNANMQYVLLEVDGDAPKNQGVRQQLDEGEFIEVELVPWDGLMQHIEAEMLRSGCDVDARLLSYAYAMQQAQHAQQEAAGAAGQVQGARRGSVDASADGAASRSSAGVSGPGSAAAATAAAVWQKQHVEYEAARAAFGSPIMSAADGSSSGVCLPPHISLDGQPDGAGAAAAAAESAAAGPAMLPASSGSIAISKPCASGVCSNSGVTSSPHSPQLLFAAGVAVGAACCWLLARNGALGAARQ